MSFNQIKNYIREVGVLVCILLIAHLGNFIDLDTYFGYFLVITLIFFKKEEVFTTIDDEGFFIFLFSFIYTLFNAMGDNKGFQFLVIQSVFPLFFYQLGKILVTKNITSQRLMMVLIFLGLCFSVTAILSVGSNLLGAGFIAEERGVPSFWTGRQLSATGISANLIFNLLLPGILLVNRKRIKFPLILFFTVVYIVSILCTFRLGSRTNLAIVVIGFLVGYFQVLLSQSLTQNLKFVFVSIIVVFLAIKFLPFDPDADYFSVLGDRLSNSRTSSISTAGNRTQLWEHAIESFWEHPLGWGGNHYAHNTWLDIARVAGIIPFILFIIVNLLCVGNLWKIFKNKQYDTGVSTIFILYILSCFLVFFGEPMVIGNFYLITLYFLFQGMLKKYTQTKAMAIKK